MKTVSKEWVQRLVAAGWVRETHFVYVLRPVKEYVAQNAESGFSWVLWTTAQAKAFYGDITVHKDCLFTPTTDEIGDELSYEEFQHAWMNSEVSHPDKPGTYVRFTRWLYTTLLSPDRMAEVWVKLHEKD